MERRFDFGALAESGQCESNDRFTPHHEHNDVMRAEQQLIVTGRRYGAAAEVAFGQPVGSKLTPTRTMIMAAMHITSSNSASYSVRSTSVDPLIAGEIVTSVPSSATTSAKPQAGRQCPKT